MAGFTVLLIIEANTRTLMCFHVHGIFKCTSNYFYYWKRLSGVTQSVTCLTADHGVMKSIPARSRTFVEIDCEIISPFR